VMASELVTRSRHPVQEPRFCAVAFVGTCDPDEKTKALWEAAMVGLGGVNVALVQHLDVTLHEVFAVFRNESITLKQSGIRALKELMKRIDLKAYSDRILALLLEEIPRYGWDGKEEVFRTLTEFGRLTKGSLSAGQVTSIFRSLNGVLCKRTEQTSKAYLGDVLNTVCDLANDVFPDQRNSGDPCLLPLFGPELRRIADEMVERSTEKPGVKKASATTVNLATDKEIYRWHEREKKLAALRCSALRCAGCVWGGPSDAQRSDFEKLAAPHFRDLIENGDWTIRVSALKGLTPFVENVHPSLVTENGAALIELICDSALAVLKDEKVRALRVLGLKFLEGALGREDVRRGVQRLEKHRAALRARLQDIKVHDSRPGVDPYPALALLDKKQTSSASDEKKQGS